MSQLNKGDATFVKETKAIRFRRILAQTLATTAKNLLLIDLGLCFSLPTVIIPALTGIKNTYNTDEFLTITPTQASWLGALSYFFQPIGSLLSGTITDPLGRRRAMMLVNIPFAIGWFILFNSSTELEIFVGFAIQGLSVGLMEAPIVTYLGEICEPSTRGVLIGYTFICTTIGMFLMVFMNTLMAWRVACGVCLLVPIISAIAVFFIPETPQWLLSKGRTEDAEKALRWLRGWVPKETVAQEFQDLQRHSKLSNSCNSCIKQDITCTHPLPTIREKYAELKRKRTLKPLIIVISLFFLGQFTGLLSMKPFMVQIFKSYDIPIASDKATATMSLIDNLANIAFILLIRCAGKRRLYIGNLIGICTCSAILAWYGYHYLPNGYVSFNQADSQPFELENKNLGFIPLICLWAWSFFSFCGFIGMPWIFLSELFPFKSRGAASGVAAAINYIFGFITKKTYYNLEMMFSLPGVTLMFSIICFIGLIVAYKILPETENCSLEEIELHFADNSRPITDCKIASTRNTTKTKDCEKGNSGKIITISMSNGSDNKGFELEKV